VNDNNNETMMKISDVAKYLNMSHGSIYTKLKNKSLDIPHFQVGKTVRFLKTDIDSWLDKNKKEFSSQ
jgi:excisionase family DNA binding protein